MFVVTLAALIAAFEQLWNWRGETLCLALWIVLLGAILTMLNRARRALSFLRKK
jgi:hypothetical protein